MYLLLNRGLSCHFSWRGSDASDNPQDKQILLLGWLACWPWYGYSLGQWTQENEEEAQLALKGEYLATGEKMARAKGNWKGPSPGDCSGELFQVENLLVIGTLVLLEGLLSADNALVLAVLVKHLPNHQQQRALLYGIAGAFLFRAVALLVATFLLRSWYFLAAGAAYLAYLALSHFLSSKSLHHRKERGVMGFWKTVAVVEMTDIAFAIDSILVAVALSKKLWVVYTGGVLGILAMRMVAGLFISLLKRFPKLEDTAYLLVGWISVKLFLESFEIFKASLADTTPEDHLLPSWLFWLVMGLIAFVGALHAIGKRRLSEL